MRIGEKIPESIQRGFHELQKMIEKQEEICENCGRTEKEHHSFLKYCNFPEFEDDLEWMKRFTPKNHSQQNSIGSASLNRATSSKTLSTDTPSELPNKSKQARSGEPAEGTQNQEKEK